MNTRICEFIRICFFPLYSSNLVAIRPTTNYSIDSFFNESLAMVIIGIIIVLIRVISIVFSPLSIMFIRRVVYNNRHGIVDVCVGVCDGAAREITNNLLYANAHFLCSLSFCFFFGCI